MDLDRVLWVWWVLRYLVVEVVPVAAVVVVEAMTDVAKDDDD